MFSPPFPKDGQLIPRVLGLVVSLPARLPFWQPQGLGREAWSYFHGASISHFGSDSQRIVPRYLGFSLTTLASSSLISEITMPRTNLLGTEREDLL